MQGLGSFHSTFVTVGGNTVSFIRMYALLSALMVTKAVTISVTSTVSVLSGQLRAELTACSHPDLLCQQKDLTQVGAWPS